MIEGHFCFSGLENKFKIKGYLEEEIVPAVFSPVGNSTKWKF